MFINTPENFSSMWSELTFEYSTTEDSDIELTVIDTTTSETLGVKKFYSSSTAKINIAPMLLDSMMPTPVRKSSSILTTSDSGFPSIRVVAQDGSSSGDKIFTYAKEVVATPALLTSQPLERILYPTECDSVAIVAPEGGSLKYQLWAYPRDESAVILLQTGLASVNGGARVFYINADQYAEDYKMVSVELIWGTTTVGIVHYTLEREPTAGYRVAWISSKGSIEHYTFPVVVDKSVDSDAAVSYSLRSAYSTSERHEALSEIISSPKVWRATESGYTQIECTTDELYVRQDGALSIANIKVKENG